MVTKHIKTCHKVPIAQFYYTSDPSTCFNARITRKLSRNGLCQWNGFSDMRWKKKIPQQVDFTFFTLRISFKKNNWPRVNRRFSWLICNWTKLIKNKNKIIFGKASIKFCWLRFIIYDPMIWSLNLFITISVYTFPSNFVIKIT